MKKLDRTEGSARGEVGGRQVLAEMRVERLSIFATVEELQTEDGPRIWARVYTIRWLWKFFKASEVLNF